MRVEPDARAGGRWRTYRRQQSGNGLRGYMLLLSSACALVSAFPHVGPEPQQTGVTQRTCTS